MFGKKQEYTKELQDRIDQAESELESMQEKMRQAANGTQQMLPCFESQIVAQSEMDKELTKIVSFTHDTMAANHENEQALEQLAIEFTNVRAMLQDDETERNKIKESVHKQAKQADAAAEKNKQCAAFAEQLQKVYKGFAVNVERMQSQLKVMVDFSKDMSVLSLNCAIEAGRLGESGRNFISASEDVRQMSCAYEQAAQAVTSQLAELEEQILEMEKQALGLSKGLSDGQAGITHLTKNISDNVDLCEKSVQRATPKKMSALTDYLKKISQNHRTIGMLQQQTLDEMEQIGKSFMDEQEARKELEQITSNITSCVHADIPKR